MASLFFKDMKRASFSSCSSPASTSICRAAVLRPPSAALDRHTPHLRDPQRSASKPPPRPKAAAKKTKDSKQSKKAASTSTRPPAALVSPASSSRFLLNSSRLQAGDVPDVAGSSSPPPFIDVFPGAVPEAAEPAEDRLPEMRPAKRDHGADEGVVLRSCSTRTRDQVVVLRVSLHCKGCAGKVRKHISKMEGVTSFDIDLAAKKVTVVGDVTPLGVLNSISKVKSAQFWPSPPHPPRASASF